MRNPRQKEEMMDSSDKILELKDMKVSWLHSVGNTLLSLFTCYSLKISVQMLLFLSLSTMTLNNDHLGIKE